MADLYRDIFEIGTTAGQAIGTALGTYLYEVGINERLRSIIDAMESGERRKIGNQEFVKIVMREEGKEKGEKKGDEEGVWVPYVPLSRNVIGKMNLRQKEAILNTLLSQVAMGRTEEDLKVLQEEEDYKKKARDLSKLMTMESIKIRQANPDLSSFLMDYLTNTYMTVPKWRDRYELLNEFWEMYRKGEISTKKVEKEGEEEGVKKEGEKEVKLGVKGEKKEKKVGGGKEGKGDKGEEKKGKKEEKRIGNEGEEKKGEKEEKRIEDIEKRIEDILSKIFRKEFEEVK